MTPSLTDTLCTQCGLCCDGSLFADVELAGRAEATGLEAMGLEIEDDDAGGSLLVQPCGALRGKRCSIYAHRPECCRTFECRLLRDVRRGKMTVKRAAEHITEALRLAVRVRNLSAELGQRDAHLPLKELGLKALAMDVAADSTATARRKRAELAGAMSALESLIVTEFLGRLD